MDELEAALKEAKDVGAGMFEVPDDTAFGERAIKHAEWKLQVARHVHAGGSASDMEEKQTVTGKEDDGVPDPERKEMQISYATIVVERVIALQVAHIQKATLKEVEKVEKAMASRKANG